MDSAIQERKDETARENLLNLHTDQQRQDAKIRAITAMAKAARDEANELDLKFEAYLLDMAVVALSEQLQK